MFKIMIDSGHIGPTYNAGAVKGYYESAIVWALHKKLVAELKKYNCQVDATRPSINTDMDVYPRGVKAKGYDLFLSLHTNWCGTESVNRTDVYVPKENTGEPKAFGLLLAKAIKKVCGTTGAETVTRKNSSGGEWYGVMRGADNVGCRFYYIVEHGFHSNRSFCNWMMKEDNLSELAKAEAQCIASYFGLKANNSKTKIMGTAEATADQMKAYIKVKNSKVSQSVLDMIPFYLSEGAAEGVRGDIAFAQSCLETGNFTFAGSAVTLSQNNFCGLGVVANGTKGSSFSTPQIGIRAQIQHLKAYASKEALKHDCVDLRYSLVEKSCAEYVEYLGQKENPKGCGWAAGANYGYKILNILDAVCSMKAIGDNKDKADGKTENASQSFKVKVSVSDLRIRKGPGTNYDSTGRCTGKGIFTIVETKSGMGSKAGWGRLKSGAGWIALDYAVKV